jgi:glutamine synthetase
MDALPKLTDEKNIELFEKHRVLNEREIHSRQEIWAEQYLTTINIEADTTEAMAKTMIYPAAVRYMNELAENVERVDRLGLATTGSSAMLNKVNDGLNDLNKALEKLREEVLDVEDENIIDRATHVKEKVIPAMNDIRDAVDFLERHTADDYWPLPIYREMLFVK